MIKERSAQIGDRVQWKIHPSGSMRTGEVVAISGENGEIMLKVWYEVKGEHFKGWLRESICELL